MVKNFKGIVLKNFMIFKNTRKTKKNVNITLFVVLKQIILTHISFILDTQRVSRARELYKIKLH